MSDGIFNQRFVQSREIDRAWHMLGTVTDEPQSAEQAFEIAGVYDTELQDLISASNPELAVPYRLLVRTATTLEPELVLGVVGPEYRLLTPREFCRVWDKSVNQAITTLGVLHEGKELFLCKKLAPFCVGSEDEIQTFLTAVSPYDGIKAYWAIISPVAVVCANTLAMSMRAAKVTHKIKHTQLATAELADWLPMAVNRLEEKNRLAEQLFTKWTKVTVTSADAANLAGEIYPIPDHPNENFMTAQRFERAMVEYERERRNNLRAQDLVQELFGGKATGADMATRKDTAWGFYNAACEYEDYCKKDFNEKSTAYHLLFGTRAANKQNAYVTVERFAAA